jgi:hypothetical protein
MTAAAMVAGVLMFGGFAQAASLEFSLADSYGRQVASQDYEGVPLFLEFGACW